MKLKIFNRVKEGEQTKECYIMYEVSPGIYNTINKISESMNTRLLVKYFDNLGCAEEYIEDIRKCGLDSNGCLLPEAISTIEL